MRTDYFRIAYGVSRFELRLMQRNKTAFADPLISLVGRRNSILPPDRASASANDFAHLLAPALRAIRAEGVTTLRSIAQALNRRGIKSPRGGTWYPSSVANVLSRSDAFL